MMFSDHMEQISEYRILEKIDETRGSIVFRGQKENKKETVVIKILKAAHLSPSEVARFKQEYQIIKNIQLDGIIKTHDIVKYNNSYALILEDFKGIKLQSILREAPIDIKTFLHMAISLTDTLDNLHKENIVHKDIKPQNILFNKEDGSIKITDFGISSVLTHENEEIYNTDVIQGTLAYMSPEQTGRMNRNVDHRTDLYSLGITFYEMLTGAVPFTTSDPMEIMHAHIARIPSPPADIDHNIPKAVSDIVMKLISKTAGERYQSCFGLKADLEECLYQLNTKGAIDHFEPAQKDISLKYTIPRKLFGRATETDLLISVFVNACRGGREIAMVSGATGIGKSALINEIHRPIVESKGYFISGKCEQFRQDVPNSAIIQAFQGLIRQILSESENQINNWKNILLEVLGPNGKVITDVIPEVELIIGSQPDVPELDHDETQNRFRLVFEQFTGVFSKIDHPLVIFMDDLQWVDLSSLKLIKNILASASIDSLFVIGAYRDNEITENHPLVKALGDMTKEGIKVKTIHLKPLTNNHVSLLITDFMKCSMEKGVLLGELVHSKTGGNPFFVNQFLQTLTSEKIIEPDVDEGWKWDPERISRIQVTDNVLDLMVAKISRLPDNIQEILKICACIGSRFDLETLSLVLDMPIEETLQNLMAAVDESLIYMSKDDYHFYHDRIQEAAYSLMSSSEKSEIHHRIGKLTLEKTNERDLRKKLFYIVDQLNFGSELMTDSKEREEMAKLNLKAGKKAKASGAYSPAFRYLNTAINLLEKECWQRQYDLALAVHTESVETAFLMGNFDRMDHLASYAFHHAKTLVDKVKLYVTRINACKAQQKNSEAIDIALDIFGRLGYQLSKKPNKVLIIKELIKVRLALIGKKPEDLLNLPEITDPKILSITKIGKCIGPVIWTSAPELFPLYILKAVGMTLTYGRSPAAPGAFAGYGMILSAGIGDVNGGYQYGLLALKMADKFKTKEIRPRVMIICNFLLRPWNEAFHTFIDSYTEAHQIAMETGHLEEAAISLQLSDANHFLIGRRLTKLHQIMKKNHQAIRQINQKQVEDHHSLLWQAVLNLMEEKDDPILLTGRVIDENKILPRFLEANDHTGIGYYFLIKIMLCIYFQNYPEAMQYTEKLEPHLSGIKGTFFHFFCRLFGTLSMLGIYSDAPKDKQAAYLKVIKRNLKKIKKWADRAPVNYINKYYMVKAEHLRILRKDLEAMAAYKKAISLSIENKYVNDEALANELAARFYLSRGYDDIASTYLNKAQSGYLRWGALAKISHMDKQNPELMSSPESISRPDSSSGPRQSFIIDLQVLIKSLRTIAEENIHSKMIEKIIRTAIEFAGAQKGVLVLRKETETDKSRLFIEAEGSVDKDHVTILQSIPTEQSNNLCQTVINYVKRTRESVVVDNAEKPFEKLPRLQSDSYIQQNRIKSILCMPILVGQEKSADLVGLLYLENNLATSTFTRERIEILEIICLSAAGRLELSAKAVTDGLTGLYNYGYFYSILQQELLLAMRKDRKLSLIMIDIDFFKAFNDTWGHQAGDLVLKKVAETIKHICRGSDIVSRYGGEEFVIILPETAQDGALELAEKIRKEVEDLTVSYPMFEDTGNTFKLTVSLGVSAYPNHAKDKDLLIRQADEAMYQSKKNGKNRVTLATEGSE